MPDKGLVIINTGNGKGKTTAALGLAMRAAGQGLNVIMIQFIKGNWHYGELDSAKKLGFKILPMGEGFTWETRDRVRDLKKAQEAFSLCKECVTSGEYDMVIMDEINYVISYGYLGVTEVLEMIEKKPAEVHLVLTGRDADPRIIEAADLVTEMKEIKHPFQKGITGQKGIEY